MDGEEPQDNSGLVDRFVLLGAITARLHLQSQNWVRPPGFVRKVWNFDTTLGAHPHWGDWRNALGLGAEGQRVLGRCIDLLHRQLEEFGSDSGRFGLVHADLRLANLLVKGDRIGVIDFDDCGFCWYLYDFAAAISFIETSPSIPALKDAWVRGYRQVCALEADLVEALKMFVMLRRILLTAWIGSHSETPTARELGTGFTADSVAMATQYLDGKSPF